MRILVVDDSQDAVTSLAKLLTLHGHDVCTAHDGLEAVCVAETFRPEVILLDIGLPKLDGLEVCSRIRGKDWSGETVIIALTGWSEHDDRVRTRTSGFDAYLVKPVEFPALLKVLKETRKET